MEVPTVHGLHILGKRSLLVIEYHGQKSRTYCVLSEESFRDVPADDRTAAAPGFDEYN